MPVFLSDPPPFWIVLLVLAVAISAFVWWRNRTRNSQIALAVIGLVVIVLLGLSYWFQSPREQAITRVNAVIAAMNRYDSGSALQHVSDRFNYRGAKKADLRDAQLNQILRQYRAVIGAWGFSRELTEYEPGNNRCTISFSVNVSGDLGSRPGFFVKATVGKDPDGEYRLEGFKVFENSMQGTNSSEFVVPGLGR